MTMAWKSGEPVFMVGGGYSGLYQVPESQISGYMLLSMFVSDSTMNSYSGGFCSSTSSSPSMSSSYIPGLNLDLNEVIIYEIIQVQRIKMIFTLCTRRGLQGRTRKRAMSKSNILKENLSCNSSTVNFWYKYAKYNDFLNPCPNFSYWTSAKQRKAPKFQSKWLSLFSHSVITKDQLQGQQSWLNHNCVNDII